MGWGGEGWATVTDRGATFPAPFMTVLGRLLRVVEFLKLYGRLVVLRNVEA
jgi:hypothetical protein